MHNEFPNLFSPMQVGNVVFRNRIFCAPSNHDMQGRENHPTEAAITYYANKARGGAAMITCGSCKADPLDLPPTLELRPAWNQYNIHDKLNLRYFAQQADAVHHFGAKASLELFIGNNQMYSAKSAKKRPFYMPSDTVMPDGVTVPQMPVEEMERIANAYADACENMVIAKYDAVLIHGGHGMFLEQFISPLYNKRTDEFGGSMSNRAKFPIMILDAIRKRVGRELLIEYRISGSEYTPGGLEIDECIEFLKLVEDKIDLAHVSGGDASNGRTRSIMHPSGFIEETPFRQWQRAVKQSGLKVPVVSVGGVHDPKTAEDIIASGDADFVTTVRGLIADPDMPRKAKSGRYEDIVPCVRCFNCLDDHKDARFFSCTVNPAIGREHHLPYWGNGGVGESKNVVVIGGGPAGMEAAIDAARYGHKVTLYEKSDVLGGNINFAKHVKFKTGLKKFRDYLVRQVEKSDITVKMNTEATPELIRAENADVVIAAVGASPVVPPIEGARGANVINAVEAYDMVDSLPENIVVIGGGQVGCETALHLAQSGKKVTVLEMASKLAADAMLTYRIPLMEGLEASTSIITGGKCEKITDTSVIYSDKDGATHELKADKVVIAVGMRAHLAEARSFEDTAFDFRMIGDCVRARNVKWAIREAYDAAMEIGGGF